METEFQQFHKKKNQEKQKNISINLIDIAVAENHFTIAATVVIV